MLSLAFDDLIIREQSRRVSERQPKINPVGFDTETINGECVLIADSEGNYLHPKNFYEIAEFLTAKRNRQKTGFFYNLKYDFQAILKHLDPEHWQTIYHTGELTLENYRLKYIPKKMLIIYRQAGEDKKTGKPIYRRFRFFDIAQYFRMKLDDAAKQYLGKAKTEHPYNLAALTLDDVHQPDFIKYCLDDSKLARELAEYWINLCNSQGLYTSNFSSPASIAGRYFSQHCKMPDVNKLIQTERGLNILRYGWNTCAGAFISCFKRGYFDAVHEYDIRSAYPAEMAKFPDLRGGYFKYSNRFQPAAKLAWLRCMVEIDLDRKESYHPSIPITRERASNYYPVGTYEAFLTLDEYLYYSAMYPVDILDGVYWIPENDLTFPFKETIEGLYYKRQATKDKNVNFFIKIILNGIYGKFLEKHRVLNPEDEQYGKYPTGNFFNPFVASYILAGARLQVHKLLATVPNENIVACFTDSVLVAGDPLPIGENKTLGAWNYEQSGAAVVIGCGVYCIDTGSKIKTRVRGCQTAGKINLFHELEKDQEKIIVPIKTNFSPLSAIIQKKPDEMNFLLDGKKEINVNFDTKRVWHRAFRSSRELLEKQSDSTPFYHGI